MVGAYDPANRNRILVAAVIAVQEASRQQVTVDESVSIRMDGGGGGGGGGVMKQCVCSPTRHPGSFRCRYHHTEYKWVGRLGPKPS